MTRIKNIFLVLLGTLFLFACEEDEKLILDIDAAQAPVLQSPAPSGLQFTRDDEESTITFSWSKAEMGLNLSTDYMVQFSTDNFQSVNETAFTTQKTTYDATVGSINSAFLRMGISPGENVTVQCRVAAKVSDNVDIIYSSVSEYDVTPYENLIDYPMIYVPGKYQGWVPGAENGRLYSYNSDDTYEGIIRIDGTDGNFKLTPEANWDNAWGGTLTAKSNGYTATLDPSGDNFNATPGTYQFTVDVGALTLDMTETDDWGIIGSAVDPEDVDWTTDKNMNYNGQRKLWEIETYLYVGQMKFRANNSWSLNYGSNNADGNLDSGGTNLEITEAGNYMVRLDLENMTYSIESAD